MSASIKEAMPLLARHEGVWEGWYRYYDIDGNKIDEHRSRLVCLFEDEHTYHQTNYYTWPDGREQVRDFPTRFDGEKLVFFTEIHGWAAEVPLDEHQRTIMLHWTRKGEPDLYLYEMIQLSDSGRHRARVWQWFKHDRLFQRTLIDETRVADRP